MKIYFIINIFNFFSRNITNNIEFGKYFPNISQIFFKNILQNTLVVRVLCLYLMNNFVEDQRAC